MNPSRIRYLTLCLGLVACGDRPPKPPEVNEALPNVPLPPMSSFVDRSGGADALQLTVRSPAKADVVAAYYRDVFAKGGWRLVNEAKDAEGATVLFAQRDGPPLWVRIWNATGSKGSFVQLSGAVMPKSDSAPKQPSLKKPSS